MELIETRIVKRAKKGDRLAFAELVELYKDKLYNLTYRMLGNPHDAEEALQEAFLKAYANLNRYDERHKFSTWMYRIASNTCIDRLRKKKIEYSLDAPLDDEESPDLYSVLSSQEAMPVDQVVQGETTRELQLAIDQLPPSYRSVIILKYIQDLSLLEISEVLSIPVSTVKTRLHRGREALRNSMIQK